MHRSRRSLPARLCVLGCALAIVLLGVGGASAAKPVVVTGRVCDGAPQPVALANLPTAPDPALLAILGVLRRPQVPADIPPRSPFPDLERQGVETGYERLLATTPRGDRFFLIPGFLAPPAIPTKCKPPLTPQQVQQLQSLQQQAVLHPRFELSVSELVPGGAAAGGGGVASTAAEVTAGLAVGSSFGGGGSSSGRYETESGTIDGLVPDGVAAVELEYRHRASRTLAVSDNFFVLTVSGRVRRPKVVRSPDGLPLPPASPFPPSTGPIAPIAPVAIVWRDAQGAAIKTIRQPAYCSGRQGTALARCLKTLPRP
jgi:hypothetical protein